MSENTLGSKNSSGNPRQWRKIEDGLSIGKDLRNSVEDGELRKALDSMLPDSEFEVFALHMYNGSGEVRELPTEVVLSTKDPEDFTMEVFSVKELDKTTNRTHKNYDDRIDHLEVLHQAAQGTGHGYAHRTNRGSKEKLTIADLEGLTGRILKGQDEEKWVIEQDTGPWTGKMYPNPVDFYRMAPKSQRVFDDPEIDNYIGIYLDNYRDFIDVVVNDYEHEYEAWSAVIEEDYESLAKHAEGFSAEGIKQVLSSFPEQMDRLYNQARH